MPEHGDEPAVPADPVFDLTGYFDAEIGSVVERLAITCREKGIPMLATFCVASDGGSRVTCAETLISRDGWRPNVIKAALCAMRSGAVNEEQERSD